MPNMKGELNMEFVIIVGCLSIVEYLRRQERRRAYRRMEERLERKYLNRNRRPEIEHYGPEHKDYSIEDRRRR